MENKLTQEQALSILVDVAEAAIVKGSFLSRKEIVIVDAALDMFVKPKEKEAEQAEEVVAE